MISHLESHKFNAIISNFKNASLVNAKGELLFSKDADSFKTTTSRLVLFQIAKKYLSLKVGDIIISNDPENGGTSLNRIYFISCISSNLFLIWDADFNLINFKIPLTPFVESRKINDFMWSGLIEAQPQKEKFKEFFREQLQLFDHLNMFANFIHEASDETFQRQWFLVSKNIFIKHFEAKSFGQSDLSYKYKDNTLIKLKTEVDEKQNIRFFKVDFSGTTPFKPELISCASHVVESGLIIEFSKYYNLEKYLSQPILDHVKLTLPPKSIVTTANRSGEYNFELQKIVRQMMRFNLSQINLQSKKKDKKFSLYSTYLMQLNSHDETNHIFLSNSRIEFKSLNFFDQKVFQNIEGEYKALLTFNSEQSVQLKLTGISSEEDHSKRWIKINDQPIKHGSIALKKGDEVAFNWKI